MSADELWKFFEDIIVDGNGDLILCDACPCIISDCTTCTELGHWWVIPYAVEYVWKKVQGQGDRWVWQWVIYLYTGDEKCINPDTFVETFWESLGSNFSSDPPTLYGTTSDDKPGDYFNAGELSRYDEFSQYYLQACSMNYHKSNGWVYKSSTRTWWRFLYASGWNIQVSDYERRCDICDLFIPAVPDWEEDSDS
jgi:hypothetical protein